MTQEEHTWVSEALVMFLALKVGDRRTGFHFIMMYTVVEATIMGLATSLWGCLISSLCLKHSLQEFSCLLGPDSSSLSGENFPYSGYAVNVLVLLKYECHVAPVQPHQYICLLWGRTGCSSAAEGDVCSCVNYQEGLAGHGRLVYTTSADLSVYLFLCVRNTLF